jgi:hypothetical protein
MTTFEPQVEIFTRMAPLSLIARQAGRMHTGSLRFAALVEVAAAALRGAAPARLRRRRAGLRRRRAITTRHPITAPEPVSEPVSDSGSELDSDLESGAADEALLAGIRDLCRRAGAPPRARGSARAPPPLASVRATAWYRSPVRGMIRRAFELDGDAQSSPARVRAISAAGRVSARAAVAAGAFAIAADIATSDAGLIWVVWPARDPDAVADITWLIGGPTAAGVAAVAAATAVVRAALSGDNAAALAAARAGVRGFGDVPGVLPTRWIAAAAAEVATATVAIGCALGSAHALRFLTEFATEVMQAAPQSEPQHAEPQQAAPQPAP